MNVNNLARKFEDLKWKLKQHSYMQMTDNTELIIDCCKNVIKYDENFIKLRLARNYLIIVGSELQMRNFSTDGVEIKGEINSFKFENAEVDFDEK